VFRYGETLGGHVEAGMESEEGTALSSFLGASRFGEQPSVPAADGDKDLSNYFILRSIHRATPAAPACSGMFPADEGTGVSGFVFASLINRQTEAQEMLCFFAS